MSARSTQERRDADDRRHLVVGMATSGLYRMTPLELAAGWVFGVEPPVEPRPEPRSPRAVVEDLVLEQVRRPPCYVAFSGGRDSSAVLAVATAVARRHGLPPPVPITRVFPGDADADEADWQSAVIDHLGLEDWIRLRLYDECDLVGPLAGETLGRFGVVWPFAVHASLPIFDAARGARVLTGEGGDNVFGAHRSAVVRHLIAGSRGRRRGALRSLPGAVGPHVTRVRWLVRRTRRSMSMPWMQPDVRDDVLIRLALEHADAPMTWARAVRREARRRSWRLGSASIQAVADTRDVTCAHPLLDDRFLTALGGSGHRLGPMSRTDLMGRLFGDLLPSAVVGRTSKATFDSTLMGARSRAFVERWDGTGVDRDLVDAGRLRTEWQQARPHPASYGLLQAAWLATSTGRSDHATCARPERPVG